MEESRENEPFVFGKENEGLSFNGGGLTEVQRVHMWPLGEGRSLPRLLDQLLLHLGDGVAVQHLGRHRLCGSAPGGDARRHDIEGLCNVKKSCCFDKKKKKIVYLLLQKFSGCQLALWKTITPPQWKNSCNAAVCDSDQGAVLHVLPQQTVVVQSILGLPRHSVHGTLVHLVLDGSKEHEEGLACRLLAGGVNTQGLETPGRHAGAADKFVVEGKNVQWNS